ncbi:MAG: 3',5'-cyclic-nucleotide phosphodiesterase [Thermoanaerobaculia bacterium]
MRLKVLGAYGTSDATHHLTGYLVDDVVAVDAGTLTSKLTLAQQARVEIIYVTHAHADHTRDLPHLILNRFHQEAKPLIVAAEEEVMEMLIRHVFNDEVWPDFQKFRSPATGRQAIEYRALKAGRKATIDGMQLTPVKVEHTVPAAGLILQTGPQAIAFTGDTGPTSEIWKRANKVGSIVSVITEASFPNDLQQMADDSGHLTPQSLAAELRKITLDVPVYASHRKVPFETKIESEIKNIRDRRARILVEKQYTF